MLIVVERRETFHLYYPMAVHAPGDLTVTNQQAKIRDQQKYIDEGKKTGSVMLPVFFNLGVVQPEP